MKNGKVLGLFVALSLFFGQAMIAAPPTPMAPPPPPPSEPEAAPHAVQPATPAPATPAPAPMSRTARQQFRKAVRRALPAVVSVTVGKDAELGSGVIIRPEGYVLTSAHVVGSASKVTVTLRDKRVLTTSKVYLDTDTDLAVLKLDLPGNESLPFAQFGKSDDVEIGDWVLAMGAPFGLPGTVTAGILSAKGRTLGQFRFEDFLQIDAAVNPGSSGGPVIDEDGDIIGINTAIKTKSGGFQGIAFAVPSSMAEDVASELISKGQVVRGYVGVKMSAGTADSLLVRAVTPGSPASKAGLMVGDAVTAIGDLPTPDMAALNKVMFRIRPGQRLVFQLKRSGESQSLTVTVSEPPRY